MDNKIKCCGRAVRELTEQERLSNRAQCNQVRTLVIIFSIVM